MLKTHLLRYFFHTYQCCYLTTLKASGSVVIVQIMDLVAYLSCALPYTQH